MGIGDLYNSWQFAVCINKYISSSAKQFVSKGPVSFALIVSDKINGLIPFALLYNFVSLMLMIVKFIDF